MTQKETLDYWATKTVVNAFQVTCLAFVKTLLVPANSLRINLWLNMGQGVAAIPAFHIFPDGTPTSGFIDNAVARFDYQFNVDHHYRLTQAKWEIEPEGAMVVNVVETIWSGD